MREQLSTAAGWMDGTLTGRDVEFAGLSIDTRTLKQGDLFVAIAGPNFDGHNFASTALEAGAAGLVVERPVDVDGSTIVVDETRLAIGRLAKAWRRTQRATVVGITGSNGKTTLKTMISACLAEAAPTLSTAGNLNNDLGVPLTLARLEETHDFAVIEMGANRCGDIEYLVSLVEPHIVVLANAGPAHLDGFGSLDGVARGKGEILEGQPRPKTAVLNANDHYFDFWRSLAEDLQIRSFGIDVDADVTATAIEATEDGSHFTLHADGESVAVSLPLPGMHNVRNACATAAAVLAAGLSLEQVAAGLCRVAAVGGRLKSQPGINGCRLFDDSYNANPGSVRAAGDVLAGLEGRSLFVLGDMFELGDEAESMHRDTGVALRESGVDELHATGDFCRHAVAGFGDGGYWYDSNDALASAVAERVDAGCNVLVKGSRSMHMEDVVARLTAPEVS